MCSGAALSSRGNGVNMGGSVVGRGGGGCDGGGVWGSLPCPSSSIVSGGETAPSLAASSWSSSWICMGGRKEERREERRGNRGGGGEEGGEERGERRGEKRGNICSISTKGSDFSAHTQSPMVMLSELSAS